MAVVNTGSKLESSQYHNNQRECIRAGDDPVGKMLATQARRSEVRGQDPHPKPSVVSYVCNPDVGRGGGRRTRRAKLAATLGSRDTLSQK